MSNADPDRQRAKLLARRQIADDGCWLWPGQKTLAGYGQMRTGPGQRDYTHRISYRLLVAPIPEGTEIDHLCRNRLCYNPEHLEAVTHRENVARGEAPGAVARAKNRCKRGHDMSDAYVRKATGHRRCRTCELASQAARKTRLRELAHARPEPSERKRQSAA